MSLNIHNPVEEYYVPKSAFVKGVLKMLPLLDRFFHHCPLAVRSFIYNEKIYVNERAIEIPFVLVNLDPEPQKILDVGCSRSSLSMQIAGLGHKVWGLDINDYGMENPPFTFTKQDIYKTDFENNYFDCVVSVSTIEHIGLGAYGDIASEGKELPVIDEIYRILKPGGKLIVTLPFGIRSTGKTLRIYDQESLDTLLKKFQVEKVKYYYKDKNTWVQCPRERAAQEGWNEKGRNNGIVLVVARKK